MTINEIVSDKTIKKLIDKGVTPEDTWDMVIWSLKEALQCPLKDNNDYWEVNKFYLDVHYRFKDEYRRLYRG